MHKYHFYGLKLCIIVISTFQSIINRYGTPCRIISNLLIAHLFSLITGDLDYEKQSLHQLRIVAKDRANFGRVNSATTGILIRVQDIEDKAPEFVSVPSVTRIAEDVPTFTEVCSCS